MPKQAPRTLELLHKQFITPNMLRLTLGGEGLNDFPQDQESGYVKLMYPSESGKPLVRTYTIRHQRDNEIDIDFALHGDASTACHWARHATIGEHIQVGGPGPKKLIAEGTDWLLFVGDMTSLPTISVNLAKLPKQAKGYAVLEVQSEADIQTLEKPEGIEIKWVINPNPGQDSEALLEYIKTLDWFNGSLAVWAACEFSSMRNLRAFFKTRKEVDKAHLYISSYWKLGLNEDQHKIEKRTDLDNDQAS